ncbi:MAG: YafY family transcriptional regulator [Proteobacteria bacterium]|nr:YafY family transcriptional regulator [Pseudomonadota bacterium]
MRRADRLFQLVQHLRARRFATGEQLARELGVSKRTIYRDMRDLEASGVPIRGEAGVGYRLDRGFELPPLIFTGEELEGLVLGARIVAAWGDPELASAVGSAMTKIEAVLPDALRRVVLETALFAPGFAARSRGLAEMATLRRGISDKRLVHFEYAREDGTPSERDVRPLGLYFWGRKWTLAAWCELRRDYRSFRPDRMRNVSLLPRTFDGSDGITLAAFLAVVEDGECRGEPMSLGPPPTRAARARPEFGTSGP